MRRDTRRTLEDPSGADARANLAACYWRAGRIVDAIALEDTVVADSERLLGPEHPDTLRARTNLAASYWLAGRAAEAIALLEVTLAKSERSLGARTPRHHDGSRGG